MTRYVLIWAILGAGSLCGCEKESAKDAVVEHKVLEIRGDVMMEKAVFGGGCFWGTEAAFRQIKGVSETAVGYMGGNLEDPTYQDVCRGTTNHAEVVQVRYDPEKLSYEKLLEVFWANHDPTTLNRQGPDVGTQYRSVIFYQSPQQQTAATASKEDLQKSHTYQSKQIVTEIVESGTFYRAEEYHQQYLEKRGLSQCHF
jgi:peptide-methionine (S)-S-oxide reductase